MDTDQSKLNPQGGWDAPPGSPFRTLTAEEVKDLQAAPFPAAFGGPHNATWEQHHPVARAAWLKRGFSPPAA